MALMIYLDQAIIFLVLHCHEDSMAQDVHQGVTMSCGTWVLFLGWSSAERNSAICGGRLELCHLCYDAQPISEILTS